MPDKKTTESMTAAEILCDARTNGRRKRELATIARQLCIKEEFLEALESGEYNKIPEEVYLLGFARNYAMELGLDPDQIIEKIKRETGITRENLDAEPAKKPERAKKQTILKPFGKSLAKRWKPIAAIIATVLVVAVVAAIATREQPASEPEPAIVEDSNPAPEFKLAVKNEFGVENKAAAAVALQATAETWLKVEDVRGETLFSRVLMPGDVYFAPSGAKATVGNAGGLDVWVNGNPAPKLGASGAKKSGIALSPENLLKAE
jgi:cytoskeleton protein RodZ